MRKSVVSIFLLLLFSIVIAFPGYGFRACVKKTNCVLCASESSDKVPGLLDVIKQCLAKGINMVEEERSTEEDEGGTSLVFEHITYSVQPGENALSKHLSVYISPLGNLSIPIVFTPPDCISKV